MDDRDGVLGRLGGAFLCVLTLVLVIGDGALMVTGTLPVPWGIGFLVLYLFGHTAFVQVLGAIAHMQDCVSARRPICDCSTSSMTTICEPTSGGLRRVSIAFPS